MNKNAKKRSQMLDFLRDETPGPQQQSHRTRRDNRGSMKEEEPHLQLQRDALPHQDTSIMAKDVAFFKHTPMLPGLLQSIQDNLTFQATPTNIQKLSFTHFFGKRAQIETPIVERSQPSPPTLLAAETGSGKSIAYLVPLLHALKFSENKVKDQEDPSYRNRPTNSPRALVIAPTHELSRQLSAFAKGLSHNIKIKVLCTSQANKGTSTGQHLQTAVEDETVETGEIAVLRASQKEEEVYALPAHGVVPVDVVVGTPARLLDLTRGRAWKDEIEAKLPHNSDKKTPAPSLPPVGWKPEIDLSYVEWVVVDEADVLLNPDFVDSMEMLLGAISDIRKPSYPSSLYPFNLVLSSATIPPALNAYLQEKLPTVTRLTSINLHQLPPSIVPEHFTWTGGNKMADIVNRMKNVWAEDASAHAAAVANADTLFKTSKGKRKVTVPPLQKSKVIIFCNKSTKAEAIANHLIEHDIPAVPLVRTISEFSSAEKPPSEDEEQAEVGAGRTGGRRRPAVRARNNDNAIAPFLRSRKPDGTITPDTPLKPQSENDPLVLVTTSLLSRGLDFNSSVKHVFIVDEPKNMVDFLHRAGRTGRAGQAGKVVIFAHKRGGPSGKRDRGDGRNTRNVRDIVRSLSSRDDYRRPGKRAEWSS
jgi:ATP-dependent RNA helicase MRH4